MQSGSHFVYPTLETLLGLKIEGTRLKARVHNNGLTNRNSFSLHVIKGFTGAPPHYINIKRLQLDQGRAYLPNGVEIEFLLDEKIENETFFVTNQIKRNYKSLWEQSLKDLFSLLSKQTDRESHKNLLLTRIYL